MNDPKLPVSGDQRDEQSNRAVVTATVEDQYVHSNVFARLVRDQHDLTGLVAYGLYKIRKREWIDKHENELGFPPARDDVKKYMFAWGDFALNALRQAAEEKLSQFAQTVVDTKYDELRRNALNEQTKAEIGEFKKLVQKQGGFLHHIVGHVIGFIALIVLAAIFYFALAHEPSLSGAVDWIKSRFQ